MSHSDFTIFQPAFAYRITNVLLNAQNFAVWSQSLHLYLGGKGKSHWLLESMVQPPDSDPKWVQWDIDNYTMLGWIFNSMEDLIYNIFMYCDTVPRLWSALSQMYANAQNNTCIFELYQDIYHVSQEAMDFSIAKFFGYLQARWEELNY